MAVIDITQTKVGKAGADAVETGMSAGNTYRYLNDGSQVLHIFRSAGASPSNVTITSGGTVDGLAINDLAVAIPNSDPDRGVVFKPFEPNVWNDSSGYVNMTVIDSMTAVVWRL